MPSYPPRAEPVKKQEELAKREMELVLAIKTNISADKLTKFVDKYRQAQLSMLKARVHQFKEHELQGKQNKVEIETLENLRIEWTDKTNEDIINKIKKSNNL
jgi:hypothetical protein